MLEGEREERLGPEGRCGDTPARPDDGRSHRRAIGLDRLGQAVVAYLKMVATTSEGRADEQH